MSARAIKLSPAGHAPRTLAEVTADRDNSNRLLDEARRERDFLQKVAADRSGHIEALAAELRGFVEWAEEHRRNAKALGERPAIDAHRITRAKAALKRAGL